MPLFLAILLLVIIAYIWRARKNRSIIKKIKKNPGMTNAVVKRYAGLRYRWRNNIWFYYEYTVGNQLFKGRTKNYHKVFYKENFNYLNGTTFPYVYSADKPTLGRMLITEADFKEFGLQQPAHLKEFNQKLIA